MSVPVSVCLYISVFVSVSVSIHLCLSVCLSLSLSLSVSLCLSVCLSVSLSLSLCPSFPFSCSASTCLSASRLLSVSAWCHHCWNSLQQINVKNLWSERLDFIMIFHRVCSGDVLSESSDRHGQRQAPLQDGQASSGHVGRHGLHVVSIA